MNKQEIYDRLNKIISEKSIPKVVSDEVVETPCKLCGGYLAECDCNGGVVQGAI